MNETLATLVPALSFLASTAGAGYAASHLFDALRRWFPRPSQYEWAQTPHWRKVVYRALWSPRGSRLTVFALAAVVAILDSVATATATGRDPFLALDAALAVVVSQLIHGAGLSGRVDSL